VHGTTNLATGIVSNEKKDDGTEHWNDDSEDGKAFRRYIKDLFGYDYYMPEWDGGNRVSSRIQGAEAIAGQIAVWHRANPDKPIILIGYSHGGNVNKEIVNILARDNPPIFVNTLINIAIPIRPDFTLNARVGQHINVFNRGDAIQVAGARHTGTEEVIDFYTGMPRTVPRRVTPDDPRRYGGTVYNIEVPRRHLFGPRANHKFMHTDPEVWKRIEELIILPPFCYNLPCIYLKKLS